MASKKELEEKITMLRREITNNHDSFMALMDSHTELEQTIKNQHDRYFEKVGEMEEVIEALYSANENLGSFIIRSIEEGG